MRLVIKTFIFHLSCILIFTMVYLSNKNLFQKNDKVNNLEFIDFLSLSTTIQTSVGHSNIYPTENKLKIITIIQQLFMLSANIFTIYIFSL